MGSSRAGPPIRELQARRPATAHLRGDSWFDYPPHPNIIDFLDGEGLWGIKRFEKSGDTLANIADPGNLARIASTAQKENPAIRSQGTGDKVGSVVALSVLVSPFFLFKKGNDVAYQPGTRVAVFTSEKMDVRAWRQ